MSRMSLLAVLSALLLGIAAPAGAQTATTTDVIDDAVEGLRNDPLYVHPDAEADIAAGNADNLRRRLGGSGMGPVYIAVLPESALNAAGGSPDGLLPLLNQGLERPGTFAVVAGRRLAAGATEN